MSKTKLVYSCGKCAAQFSKWAGQCVNCSAWNSIVEEAIVVKARKLPAKGFAGLGKTKVTSMSDVTLQQQTRLPTGLKELDRVLGGGLVQGSVVLIGGDPGIGKSTILLQTLTQLSEHYKALYITGEESLQQVTLSAQRLHLNADNLLLLAETDVERIIEILQQEKPDVVVIDSIQTMYSNDLQSAPGGVSQVRESAARLVQYAKQTNTALFLVGHVTKEGALAGPRVLEHMVDTVLYFEGEGGNRFRVIRAIKNRFGAVNELGIFAMTEKGLREVSNPSAIFLTRDTKDVSGSIVMVTWEGSRPLLVEVQALVDTTHLNNPRRVTVGLEQNRLAMLLAVLHRHGGIPTYDQDVFVNVVGGVRVMETAADLPLLLTVLSSLRDQCLSRELVVFGEVGLAGEIRPVPNGPERLNEALKHGFKQAIIPKANAPKHKLDGMQIIPVQNLSEALNAIR